MVRTILLQYLIWWCFDTEHQSQTNPGHVMLSSDMSILHDDMTLKWQPGPLTRAPHLSLERASFPGSGSASVEIEGDKAKGEPILGFLGLGRGMFWILEPIRNRDRNDGNGPVGFVQCLSSPWSVNTFAQKTFNCDCSFRFFCLREMQLLDFWCYFVQGIPYGCMRWVSAGLHRPGGWSWPNNSWQWGMEIPYP